MKKKILSVIMVLAMLIPLFAVNVSATGLHSFEKTREYDGRFTDINGQWAEQYMIDLYEYGFTDGRSESAMVPSANVSLAEAVTLASRINAQYFGREITAAPAEEGAEAEGTAEAAEAVEAKWYDMYVSYALANGIIGEDEIADYTADASRGMTAKILSRSILSADIEAVRAADSFTDILKGSEYYDAVSMLSAAGIVNGYDDGTFKAENSISRAEIFTLADKLVCKELRKGYLHTEYNYSGSSGETPQAGSTWTFTGAYSGATLALDNNNRRFALYSYNLDGSVSAVSGKYTMMSADEMLCAVTDRAVPAADGVGAYVTTFIFVYDKYLCLHLDHVYLADGSCVKAVENPGGTVTYPTVLGTMPIGETLVSKK